MILFNDWTTIIASVFLLIVGIVLLNEWSRKQKETFFYWGFGLLVWGASLIMRFFMDTGLLENTHTTSFIYYYLFGLSFVFFLLYGTLILVLDKKSSNTISIIYFIAFFFVNSVLGGVSRNESILSVWHNILFITPTALVSGVYFFYYYKKLKKFEVMVMYSLWILFAIIAYTYTFIFAIDLNTPKILDIWNFANNLAIILLSISYLVMIFAQKETWHALTQIKEYFIDQSVLDFFEEYFFENSKSIIKQEMERLGIKRIKTASKVERQDFVENCIRLHFSKVASLQRQEIIRAKLLSIVGVRVDSSEGKDYGRNVVRM